MQYKDIQPDSYQDDIAIIAMNGRFPGANDIRTFWENLKEGKESITYFDRDELLAQGLNPSLLENDKFVAAEGMLQNIEYFDADFFGISPREAELMDPQHRLFLEVTWELIEKSGYVSETQAGVVAVYCGAGASSYLSRNLMTHPEFIRDVGTFKTSLATGQDFVATRASYKFGFTGPSININTLCSSSLVAVHYAREALLSYQCDMAIAGGVTISCSREDALFYQEGGIGAFDGHCRAFDAQAAGTVAGNGIAVIAMKRCEDAVRDKDQILAIIKGTAINNDGSEKSSYTAPSPNGQARAIMEAMEVANVDPETISYVEAHGTGTSLGDPIEIAGLTRAYQMKTDKKQYCGIGSVKTNIGHLVAAGGVASLIKTVLAMREKTLPANINFSSPNPNIDFGNSPFYVVDKPRRWQPTGGDVLRAGVSSFGIGGTNAHTILEQAPDIKFESTPVYGAQTIVLSARTPTALASQKEQLLAFLMEADDSISLTDLSYTLQVGRKEFEYKYIAACRNKDTLVASLQTGGLYSEDVAGLAGGRNICFMFPGQGSQYLGMGLTLYENNSIYRHQMDECLKLIRGMVSFDLKAMMFADDSIANQLSQTEVAQPALFCVEYSLAKTLQYYGIQPDACIGHSIGEYVAACLSGVFSLKDALHLVIARGQIMQSMPKGLMLAVPLAEGDVQPLLGENLWYCVQNAPQGSIIGGGESEILQLKQSLLRRGIESVVLQTSHAFHSGMMEQAIPAFRQKLREVIFSQPNIPFLSNLDGKWIGDRAVDPEYWCQHLLQTVRFADGIKTLFESYKDCALVEVGPGHSLCQFTQQQRNAPKLQFSCLPHQKQASDADLTFAMLLGRLYSIGLPPDWQKVHETAAPRRIELPTYPFERQRYWIAAAPYKETKNQFNESFATLQASSLLTRPVTAASFTIKIDRKVAKEVPVDKLLALQQLNQSWFAQLEDLFGDEFQIEDSGLLVTTAPGAGENGALAYDDIRSTVNNVNMRPFTTTQYVAASTETQQILVSQWEDVLGYQPVGILDNFFDMGGNSLMVASLAARLRKTFKLSIPLKELLLTPSILELSSVIDNQQWVLAQDCVALTETEEFEL